MGFIKDRCGGKDYFSKMGDEQLLDHLADLAVARRFFSEKGIRSMLSVIFDRVANNNAVHPELVETAKWIIALERQISNPGIGLLRMQLEDALKDRYDRNHGSTWSWRSLDL